MNSNISNNNPNINNSAKSKNGKIHGRCSTSNSVSGCFSGANLTNPDLFQVRHFAGNVCYSVVGFLEKNRDAMNQDLVRMVLDKSESTYVRKLFNCSRGGHSHCQAGPGRST